MEKINSLSYGGFHVLVYIDDFYSLLQHLSFFHKIYLVRLGQLVFSLTCFLSKNKLSSPAMFYTTLVCGKINFHGKLSFKHIKFVLRVWFYVRHLEVKTHEDFLLVITIEAHRSLFASRGIIFVIALLNYLVVMPTFTKPSKSSLGIV